jgi:hypothetical protein
MDELKTLLAHNGLSPNPVAEEGQCPEKTPDGKKKS